MAKKAMAFKGRVVSSSIDVGNPVKEITGPHQILYPSSKADVANAIAQTQGTRTIIKSGDQVTRDNTTDGTDSIVINLSMLDKITTKDGILKVESGAKVKDLADQLFAEGMALPLSSNPEKSITSNVLTDEPSLLMRTLGPLSDHVAAVQGVRPNGRQAAFNTIGGVSALAKRANANAVLTQVNLTPVPANELWLQQTSFPYPGKESFLAVAKALFMNGGVPDRADVALDAFNGQFRMPMVQIRVLCNQKSDRKKLETLVQQALAVLPEDLQEVTDQELFAGSDVMEQVRVTGFSTTPDPTMQSDKLEGKVSSTDDVEHFLIKYTENVHRGIAYSDNEDGKLHPELSLSSRIQMDNSNGLVLYGFAYVPNPSLNYPTAANADRRDVAKAMVQPLFSMAPRVEQIPGFKGQVYKKGDLKYDKKAYQYATSSYKPEDMAPFMVAYPKDVDDVKAAIAFARNNNKKVVARSGGHQYSGKSSGGKDTIVLSMDLFDQIDIVGHKVKLGPGMPLTKIAAMFKNNGITVPHGECPEVAIGGHAQTGGYGHLLRSFGLIMDHVEAFTIVLADGTVRRVSRPVPGTVAANDDERADRDLFAGVLSGNAGSFGIITQYELNCVTDDEFNKSYGFSATIQYKKQLFKNLMELTQKWTQKVEDGTMPEGLDFMMTVASKGRISFTTLLAEVVHSNPDKKEDIVAHEPLLKELIDTVKDGIRWWEHPFVKGKQEALSSLSDSFVRRFPGTINGREFIYPYKKRVNCTMNALTNEFVAQFVDLVTEVVHENADKVKLVFQMSIGGGAYRKQEYKDAVSIPLRDYVYCFVFDLFYTNGNKAVAEAFQDRMQQLIDTHYSPDQERRVFWGSFGNTDISDPEINSKYYDSPQQYAKLQQLKQLVDPTDVFHTSFTVQLP